MKIQRLTTKMCRAVGLNEGSASGMHVVSDRSINGRVPNQSYTIPQGNGIIKRITFYESALKEEILERAVDGYRTIKSRIIK